MKRMIFVIALSMIASPLFAANTFTVGTPLKVQADFDGLDAEGHPTVLLSARCRVVAIALVNATLLSNGIECELPTLAVGDYDLVVEFGNEIGVSASPNLPFSVVEANQNPNPPACTPSPDGTQTNNILTDGDCNVWSLLGDNGLSSTGKKLSYVYKGTVYVGVAESILYSGGSIFILNGTQWYKFNMDHWDAVESPIVVIPPSPTPTTITISGSVIVNGVAHPFSIVVP